MKYILVFLILFLSSCISQFVPETNENQELLVVEAIVTDNLGESTVKLSKSLPLGPKSEAKPVSDYDVTVTDDNGVTFYYYQQGPGIYKSTFSGVPGRTYTLHLTNRYGGNSYQSFPVLMQDSPPIDSLYYKKIRLGGSDHFPEEGCRIYLDTHDETNKCKYYRWEYIETWEFQLPYDVPNQTCWITNNSDIINIKNTTSLASSEIQSFPLKLITNETDRLKKKYSIQVNQYALSESEYNYWEKLQNLSEQVGGLYDIIPSSVPSNIYCTTNPDEKVLGYFSVSGISSKRLFIKDNFMGLVNLYTPEICENLTIGLYQYYPNLGVSVWVIIVHQMPDYRVITFTKRCADCTTRGSTERPYFWDEGK